MIEYYLGIPVTKEVDGKTLHVEHINNHTEIKFGDKTLILCNESVIEGLVRAVEWTAELYREEK